MRFCVIDLESIPSTTLPDGVKPEFDLDSVKLGNTKDPEKVAEKVESAKQGFSEALDKKMSLDPDLCEVVCFSGTALANGELFAFQNPKLIQSAWAYIKLVYLSHTPLVSFNGIGFDLPVLLHQAMRLSIPVSPQMYADLTKKWENRHHYDLLQWFSGWDRSKYKPLSFYLKLYGIGEQSGDGSQVFDWWKNGEYDKIRTHCEQDVSLTAQLFDRVKDWIVREDRYDESPL